MNEEFNQNQSQDQSQNQIPVQVQDNSARNFTWITYAMYVAGLFTVLLSIVGVIMAYAKRNEFTNTIYYEHMQYLIRTFWISLIGAIVGFLLLIVLVGWVVLVAVTIWYIYRIVMGAIRLYDNKAVSATSWF